MQEVQTSLPTGSVIRERYSVESLLGQGGFGAVYRVKDQRVKGNLYALKEVIEPKRKDRTRKDKNRFHFEGEVLRRLDHRALPRVYRVFADEESERTYVLMDYIDGPNLEMLRQRQPDKRFSLPEVMTIMAPIIDAVEYLHSQNPPLLHRDIKPSNIIVSGPNEAVLVDFDIAKEYDPDSTTTAIRRCSPGYGAPEQYAQGTNTRTDIYGLGATIYTLLTGVVPPDALHRMTTVSSRGRDPLIPLDQLVPDIPKSVAQAIQQAMALDSNDRFPTIDQFWQTVDAYVTQDEIPVVVPHETMPLPVVSSQPPTAKPLSGNTTTIPAKKGPPTVQVRKLRGRKLPFALALLVLLVGLASAAGLWSFLGGHKASLSVSPTNGLQETAIVEVPPSAGATMGATSTVVAGKVVPGHTPTGAITPVPPSGNPTSVPAFQPTPTPTMRPTSTPKPTPTPTPRPKPTPTATPSPTPNPYPILDNIYNGTINDTTPTPNIRTSMYLSSIKQNRGTISGYFTVDYPLVGSGPFTGTVGTNKYMQFTVKSFHGNAPLFFWGFVQTDKSIQGQYCSLDASGHCSASAGAGGYWSVVPGPPGS